MSTPLPAFAGAPAAPAARHGSAPVPATDGSWRLLAAGDEVSVAGAGAYQLVHLSAGSAWVEGLVDHSPRLVAAATLRLLRPSAGLRHS